MANPQKERGYVGIANDIWKEIIRRDFTKRQKDILQLILRLSYGCSRKIATIPKQKYFELCGVGAGHIKSELNYLVHNDVLIIQLSQKGYQLNEDYDSWGVPSVVGWDHEIFNYLIHINILESKKDKSEITETVIFSDQLEIEFPPKNITKTVIFNEGDDHMNYYQNGNFNEENQHLEENDEITETVSYENKNLPKREVGLTETVTFKVDEPIQGVAPESSKKGLKKKVIKTVLKKEIYSEIISYLNLKANKRFSPEINSTIKFINGRFSEGRTMEDFIQVIDTKTKEWLFDPKMNKYLCPSTLFNPTNFEKYLNQGGVVCDGGTGIQEHGGNNQGSSNNGNNRAGSPKSQGISDDEFDNIWNPK